MGITSIKEGFIKTDVVGVEFIWLAAALYSQREGDGAFSGLGILFGKLKLLLKVGGFDMIRGVEMTMTQVHPP